MQGRQSRGQHAVEVTAVRAAAASPGKHPLVGGARGGVIARKVSAATPAEHAKHGSASELPDRSALDRVFGPTNATAAPVQCKQAADPAAGQAAPPDASSPGQPLRSDTRAQMEASFGADFSAVRIHEGAHASALGALAYTQGADIHFAPGQYQPDSHAGRELLGHELAHVVQQSRGAVQATAQARGVDLNDDPALERESDEQGERAARGQPANAAGGHTAIAAGAAGVAQRKPVPTLYGTFRTTKLAKEGPKDSPNAVSCVLTFDPDPAKVDAKKIGLSQSFKETNPDGSHTAGDPTTEERRVRSGSGADYALDRVSRNNNPILGAPDLSPGVGLDKTLSDNNATTSKPKVAPKSDGGNATFQLGFSFTEAGQPKHQEAAMWDRPDAGVSLAFETTALAIEGVDQGKYLGSVKWGFDRKAKDIDIHDIELASMGPPTQRFLAPAAEWNKHKALGHLMVTANPAKAHKEPDMAEATLPKGTKLLQRQKGLLLDKPVLQVKLADQTGDSEPTFWVNLGDVADMHDGDQTIPLPTPKMYVNATAIVLYADAARKTKLRDVPANTRIEVTATAKTGSYATRIVDLGTSEVTGYVDPKLVKQES